MFIPCIKSIVAGQRCTTFSSDTPILRRIGRTARAYLISTNIDEIAVVAFTAFPQGYCFGIRPKVEPTVLRESESELREQESHSL